MGALRGESWKQKTLQEILQPKSIAVVGASETGEGGRYLSALLKLGFKGKIYPVHPKHPEVFGLKCYPNMRDIPDDVDYVIATIPSSLALNLIDDCAAKHVKCIHFYTARFSETGRPDAVELEKEILRRAGKAGIRIIGPNGMGVYYPEWGMSWTPAMSSQPGSSSPGRDAIAVQPGTMRHNARNITGSVIYWNE